MSTKSSNTAQAPLKNSDRQAALFESLFKTWDKQAAMSEQEERRRAEKEKTARLRGLRLAKKADERMAAAKAAATKAAATKPIATRRRSTPVIGAAKA